MKERFENSFVLVTKGMLSATMLFIKHIKNLTLVSWFASLELPPYSQRFLFSRWLWLQAFGETFNSENVQKLHSMNIFVFSKGFSLHGVLALPTMESCEDVKENHIVSRLFSSSKKLSSALIKRQKQKRPKHLHLIFLWAFFLEMFATLKVHNSLPPASKAPCNLLSSLLHTEVNWKKLF